MPENGFLTVRVYQSDAQIPIVGAAVSITQQSNNGSRLLAARLTDRSGRIEPITIEAPSRAESESPGASRPFATVDVTVGAVGFERVLVENVQIFSGVETQLDSELLPLAARPESFDITEIFVSSAQSL